MHAHRCRWLLPVLVIGMAACGGDDEVVDPGPVPDRPVAWMLSGDVSGQDGGSYAVFELHSEGPDSYVQLLLRTDAGHSLAIGSPAGEDRLTKTVYSVERDDEDNWHALLTLSRDGGLEEFTAVHGFLAVEALDDEQANGFFSLETEELDDEGEPVPDGLQVRVQGTFAARIERTSPGTRAVTKGDPGCLPVAHLGFSP